ncbi:MAG: hypothetical protein NTY37_06825 [Methanothrix sp.]|nr:hypothetical protein [Methanothrix sp.]
MATQDPLIALRLCSPEGEKIGLEVAGNLLITLQNMVWHMGNYIEGLPYCDHGRLKNQIIEDYGLVIKALSSGSIAIDVGTQETLAQARFEEGSVSLKPLAVDRAVTKVTDFIEAIRNDSGRNLDDVVSDISYKSRLLSDVSNIWPRKRGYNLNFRGQGGRCFDLSDSNRGQLERFVSVKPRDKEEEVQIGILADLRVENGKQMRIEKIGDEFTANYPPDLELKARDLLGLPVRVFGHAERISGQSKIKKFEVINIELFDKYPLIEFDFDGMKFIPNLSIETQVDYDDGFWTLSLPFIDSVGYADDFYDAERMLKEHVHFLWNEYVLCSEDELGETGKMLRKILQDIFKVTG